MSAHNHFRFFVLSVLAAIVLPQLFREGIFMDGSLYSAVAVNYARGEGTFWAPHFSQITMSFFHEQPPLLFGMLGTCFKIFGEHVLVERFYALGIFILSLFVYLSIWKKLFSENGWLIRWRWMAVLIWIIIPNTTWVVIHNLEENTMGLFVLLSVYFQIRAANSKTGMAYLFSALSGIALFLAFLTKGFPAFFPLVFFPLNYVFFKKYGTSFRVQLLNFLILFLVLTLLIVVVFLYEPSASQLKAWLYERVLNSISNVSNTAHRFEIVQDLLMQLLPVFLLFPVLMAISKWKKLKKFPVSPLEKKHAWLFLLMAAAGSLPLMITREQRGFYLATAHPYFAFFFTVIFSPLFSGLQSEHWSNAVKKISFAGTIIIFVVAFFLMFFLHATPKRDPDKWHDINIVTSRLSYGSFLAYRGDMWNDWELQTGLIRKNYISLTSDTSKTKYLITDASQHTKVDENKYREVSLKFQHYKLYLKK